MRFEAKKPYDFDRNQNRSALSKKEQPQTTGKKPRKFKHIKWLLGQQPRAFQLNGALNFGFNNNKIYYVLHLHFKNRILFDLSQKEPENSCSSRAKTNWLGPPLKKVKLL